MPRKSITELEAQATTDLPDNTSGAISPADVRQMFIDFLNAIRPAYGTLQKTTPQAISLGLTPVAFPYTTQNDSDPNQTNSSPANGQIARLARGTSTINFTMDFECTAGRFVTFTLFKNGVATLWRTTSNGGGAGNPVGVAITAVDYADPAATYEVRASAEVAATNTTLSNGAFILSVDPVNSYV